MWIVACLFRSLECFEIHCPVTKTLSQKMEKLNSKGKEVDLPPQLWFWHFVSERPGCWKINSLMSNVFQPFSKVDFVEEEWTITVIWLTSGCRVLSSVVQVKYYFSPALIQFPKKINQMCLNVLYYQSYRLLNVNCY